MTVLDCIKKTRSIDKSSFLEDVNSENVAASSATAAGVSLPEVGGGTEADDRREEAPAEDGFGRHDPDSHRPAKRSRRPPKTDEIRR